VAPDETKRIEKAGNPQKPNLGGVMRSAIGGIFVVAVLVSFARTDAAAAPLSAAEILGDNGATFDLVWDGWTGKLYFGPLSNPSLSKLDSGGKTHRVRYTILREAQETIAGPQGPGFRGTNTSSKYRVVFWIDFSDTKSLSDDQVFDGYFFTQNRPNNHQMAGITWWGNMPFGFYGKLENQVP